MFKRLFCGIAFFAIAFSGSFSHAADRGMPDKIDPAKRYIFYMHGQYIERKGPNADYKYYPILDAIEAKGFVVVGEARGPSDTRKYADGVTRKVKALLNAGVPASHITVAGHSKGGMISLTTAKKVGEREISYGMFAACGLAGSKYRRSYNQFVKKAARQLKGRFLIVWAKDDNLTGHCDEAMKKGGVRYQNLMLPAGKGGHQLFYRPDPLWLNVLVDFANGG